MKDWSCRKVTYPRLNKVINGYRNEKRDLVEDSLIQKKEKLNRPERAFSILLTGIKTVSIWFKIGFIYEPEAVKYIV